MSEKVVMTAVDSFYDTRYGMLHRGTAFEVAAGDVEALTQAGSAKPGGTITKSEPAPQNKMIDTDSVPNKRRRKPAVKEAPEVIPVPSPAEGPPLDSFVQPTHTAEITGTNDLTGVDAGPTIEPGA